MADSRIVWKQVGFLGLGDVQVCRQYWVRCRLASWLKWLAVLGMMVWLGCGMSARALASADQLSFQSARSLADSMMAALPDSLAEHKRQALQEILYSPDDLSISADSLEALSALLPLPAATILRLTASLEQHLASYPVAPARASIAPDRTAIIGFSDTRHINSQNTQRTGRPVQPNPSHRLALHAAIRQLVWQAAMAPDRLNQVPAPPLPPSIPVPPLPPVAAGGVLVPSVSVLSPMATVAISAGAAAATAGLAQSASDDTTALASKTPSTGNDSGGDNSGGDNSGGNDGGSDSGGGDSGGGNGDDSSQSLDTAIWETSEYNANYGLASLNASTAYARGYTGQGVTVSVLDSPFDTDHADLVDNLVTGYDALDGDSAVHCPQNGCISAHGTHVAGIIGATKNDTGMHGVAPDVSIKPVKIFGNDLSFASHDQLVDAINQGSGVAITAMNNSWGASVNDTLMHQGTTYHYKRPFYNYADNSSTEYVYGYLGSAALTGLSPAEITAWQNATQNTIVVFANGNDGLNTETGQIRLYSDAQMQNSALSISNSSSSGLNANIPSFRGSYPVIDSSLSGEWLTVVAVDQSNRITSFSNGCGYAKAFCIAAPGATIYSTYDVDDNTTTPPASYKQLDGTSMAAPHVTGAIALLKQQFPNLTPSQLTTLVLSTATDLGAAGIDDVYGVGLLDLAEASRPQGSLAVAGTDGRPIQGVSPQTTSIVPSAVFGQAFAHRQPTLGLIDSFGRAFEFQPRLGTAQHYEVSPDELMALLSDEGDRQDQPLISAGYLSLAVSGGQLDDDLSVSLYNQQMRLDTGRTKRIFSAPSRHYIPEAGKYPDIYSQARNSAFAQIASGKTAYSFMQSHIYLDPKLSLGMSHYRGSWQAGGQFDELSSQIGWHEAGSSLSGRFGVLREYDTVLGARLSGFYEPAAEVASRYMSMAASMPLSGTSQLRSSYMAMQTALEMKQADHVSIDGLVADSYEFTFDRWHAGQPETGRSNYAQSVSLRLPLATTGGYLSQLTTRGYQDGDYNSVLERYDLANNTRQIDLDFHHQDSLWAGGRWMLKMHASHNVSGIRNKQDAGLFLGLKQAF